MQLAILVGVRNGMLGDFGCHYMDLPYWALVDAPTRSSPRRKGPRRRWRRAMRQQVVNTSHRGNRPAVHMTWHHGGWMPEGAQKCSCSRLVRRQTRRTIASSRRKLHHAKTPTTAQQVDSGFHRPPSRMARRIKTAGRRPCPFITAAAPKTVQLRNRLPRRQRDARMGCEEACGHESRAGRGQLLIHSPPGWSL